MGGSSYQTIGYRYFMGLHMAICYGPVASIDQIFVGKRSLEITPQIANTTLVIDQAGLFGGDRKEGGIVGRVDLEFGAGDQEVNPYLSNLLGPTTPAFRYVTCVAFRDHDGSLDSKFLSSGSGGYLAAMSPYPKPWAFQVTDIPGGGFNITKQIVNGAANGGHIIYDCLTNADWGLGISGADLDTTTFKTTTDTLHTENFGLSFIYAQQSKMEDFLQEVLNHINGVLYTDRQTGAFKLKLIRDDYDPALLPIFDETNIASLISFERPAFSQMVNEIVLSYRKRGDFEDSTITVQDLASIQAQGMVVSQSVSFPGIDDPSLASLVALRELKQSSTPLARAKLAVNREAWEISPGDAIKLSWEDYGISEFILRVGSVDYGDLDNPIVVINAVEDIFSQPTISYLAPVASGWQDEIVPAEPATSTLAMEAPYFVVATQASTAITTGLLDSNAILLVAAQKPPVVAVSFDLFSKVGALPYTKGDTSAFSPTAKLFSTLDRVTTTSISIKEFRGSASSIVIGGFAFINNEVLRIDSVDAVSGLIDVGRGYLDSIPRNHPMDSIIYFADGHMAFDSTIYVNSETVLAKVLTETGLNTLPLVDAFEDTVVMNNRRARPYSAAQVRINGEYYPSTVGVTTVSVSWKHQDRTQQLTVGGQDWYEVSLGAPEAGVLYTVRYYNDDTSTLLFTHAGINGTSSSYFVGGPIGTAFNMRVEVEAIRDATISNMNTFSFVFGYNKPLEFRTLLNADTRTLESGDTRILEN